MNFKTFLIFTAILCQNLMASNKKPDYQIFKNKNYSVILDSDVKIEKKTLLQKIDKRLWSYKKLFKDSADPFVIRFFLKNNEKSNGFVQGIPFPHTHFYGFGYPLFEHIGKDNWADALIDHEFVHLFQITAHSGRFSFLKNIPVFLILYYPNLITSRFFLEGHATFLESLTGNGGRMFSGLTRAFVLSQIKTKELTYPEVLLSGKHFYSGRHFYLTGAYFQHYLFKKHSLNKINSFFKTTSQNTFQQLFLHSGSSFKKNFGTDFKKEWEDFVSKLKKEAKNLKSSKEKSFLLASSCAELNSDKEEIFFMHSKNGRKRYQILSLNKKSKKLQKTKALLPYGKLFKIDGDFYSRAVKEVASLKIKSSLWKSFFKNKKSYNSKWLISKNKGLELYIDSQNNFLETKLFLNKKLIAKKFTSAILGEDKNVYYFKQTAKGSVLFKNNKALTKIPSWYTKLLYAKNANEIYFISSTKLGSSLFAYKNAKVYQIAESDLILNALPINSSEFLTCELGKDFYEYKIVKVSPKKRLPYFINKSLALKKPILKKDIKIKNSQFKAYNGFLHMRPSLLGFDLSLSSFLDKSSKIPDLDFKLNFQDILLKKNIDISGKFKEKTQSLKISFNEEHLNHKTSFGFKYILNNKAKIKSSYLKKFTKTSDQNNKQSDNKTHTSDMQTSKTHTNKKEDFYKVQSIPENKKVLNAFLNELLKTIEAKSQKLILNLTLYKKIGPYFDFSLSSLNELSLQTKDLTKASSWNFYTGGKVLSFYEENYPLAWKNYRFFENYFLVKYNLKKSQISYIDFSNFLEFMILDRTYIEASYSQVTHKEKTKNESLISFFDSQFLYGDDIFLWLFSKATQSSIKLERFFDFKKNFNSLALSLRDFSLFFKYQNFDIDHKNLQSLKKENSQINEMSVGLSTNASFFSTDFINLSLEAGLSKLNKKPEAFFIRSYLKAKF